MDITRVVTRSRLSTDLRALGLAEGDCVMLHESVREIGWVVGGPDVVLDAVLDVLGPAGTLMKLVGSEDGTYELADWPHEVQEAYLAERPVFSRERTRACREWGILCEYLRTRPGAHRSPHPEASFAAVGRLADWLTREHPLDHGYGPGSPLGRVIEANGRVLLLGAPLDSVTLLHHAEYAAAIPHKRVARYRVPVARAGERTWLPVEELDSSLGIVPYPYGDYFARAVQAFLDAGLGRSGCVGHAQAHLLDAPALHRFGVSWFERELVRYAD
jgi:aminoglycoside 3-N-acetyltransferase